MRAKGGLKAEAEKEVEAGKKLPRKFLRLAESFEANSMSDVVFCISYRKLFKIWFFNFDKIINLRKKNHQILSLTLCIKIKLHFL